MRNSVGHTENHLNYIPPVLTVKHNNSRYSELIVLFVSLVTDFLFDVGIENIGCSHPFAIRFGGGVSTSFTY